MKKIWKSLLAFLLVVVGMTSTVFAKVDLKVIVNGSDVSIEGQSDHYSKNVMTETWNGDKKYYIDADKTNSEGNFKFNFKTKENKHFNGKVNVDGELEDFEFTTKKINDDENPPDKPSGGGGTVHHGIKKVSVYMRVEGYDKTIVPRTKVKVGLFDLNPYLSESSGSSATPSTGWGVDKFKAPTNAHAIVKILKDNHVKYDLQDYGWSLYMSEIDGDKEFNEGPMSGWMYSVNGKLPPVGCNGKPLREGDEIVWFYGAYGFDTLLTTLKSNKTQVKKGEEISLKLSGIKSEGASGTGKVGDYTQIKEPINGASILVDDEEYKIDGKVVKTDASGEAKIKFSEEGTYKLTATRYKKKPNGKIGKIDIVKPEPVIIKVGDSNSSSSSSKSTNKQKEKADKEIQEKLNKLQISSDQLKVVTKDVSCEFSVNESIINKKINEINNLFTKMEDRYKDVNIEDKKNVLIKVKGDKEKKNIFKLNSAIVNKLKDKHTGIKISFEDSDFKFDTKNVDSIKLNEYIEIRKERLNNKAYKKNIESNLKETKVISMPYDIGVYKVHKDGSEEKISMNNCNVSIKVDANSIKNIRRNSLRINYYDSKNAIWKVLDSKYITDTNVVEGKFN